MERGRLETHCGVNMSSVLKTEALCALSRAPCGVTVLKQISELPDFYKNIIGPRIHLNLIR